MKRKAEVNVMRVFRYLTVRLCVLLALLALDLGGFLGICLWYHVHGTFPTGLFLTSAVSFVLVVLALVLWVYRPYRQTTHLLELFAGGYTLQGLNNLKAPYNKAIELMIRRLMDYMHTPEQINETRRQTQYLALQNQINPHFLYNTLECIRSEALGAQIGSVADMCEALATFFRYTVSNLDMIATIEEELGNVKNYFFIQQYRFGQRIALNIEMDPADEAQILKHPIPRLTLQPIVENAILHGVEKRIGDSLIRIRFEMTPERLILIVSDNGVGIDQEVLERLNHHLHAQTPIETSNGGIALSNVNNRIKLLFGEEYGLTLYSTLDIGTDVEITIPHHSNEDILLLSQQSVAL